MPKREELKEVNWISTGDQTPPDDEVYIKDEYGNVGIGNATWYPFKVERLAGDEKKPWGWRGTPIPCDPYWDGGWLILATEGLSMHNIKGDITHWSPITTTHS